MNSGFALAICRILLALAAGGSGLRIAPLGAQTIDSDKLTELTLSLRKRQQLFAGIHSYAVSGTVTIDHSDELMRMVQPSKRADPKTQTFRFRILGRDSSIKAEYDRLGKDAKVIETRSYFLDRDNVVFVHSDEEKIAQILPLTKDNDNDGLYDWCVAFMEYGFLRSKPDDRGISALPPSALGVKDSWDLFIQSIASCRIENGQLRVITKAAPGRKVVDFSAPEYFPRKIDCYLKGDVPLRTIEVLEFAQDKFLGIRPRKVKMAHFQTTLEGDETIPIANWTFDVVDFAVNPALEENEVKFDPASVDKIWDGKNSVWIIVPK